MVELSCIKVEVVFMILSTGPDNREAETKRKSRFKIDSSTVTGKVRN